MTINMNEFIKKNRETFEKYEASGITHDFVPYDAIKRVADCLGTVEVAPFDESGVNYTISRGGKFAVVSMMNRSDLSNEEYVAMRILNTIDEMEKEV